MDRTRSSTEGGLDTQVERSLAGRAAIVFGAGSSGSDGVSIGRAISLTLARHGASVTAVDVALESAETTCALIREEGGSAVAVAADVSIEDDVAAATEQCAATFGSLDILVNNVGNTALGGIEDTSLESWDRIFATNLTGAFLSCRAAMARMREQGRGSIVNISSMNAQRVFRGRRYLSYSVSKAALNQLTRVVAMEGAAWGIRANNVILGAIDTARSRDNYQEFARKFGDGDVEKWIAARDAVAPLGRQGTPWEVAEAAAFLASDDSSYITGSDVYVDGGATLRVD